MPLPHLLKKLSRKSLRKRTQSTTNSADGPPVPNSPTNDAFFGEVTPPPLPNLSPSDSESHIDNRISPTPKTPNGNSPATHAQNGAPYPPPQPPTVAVNENAIPPDDLSLDLQSAWKSATTDPKASKADKVLQKLENGVSGAMAQQAKGAALVTTVKTGLDAVGGTEVIEKGLNTFMQGMPVLMNALDEVAKIHPFIAVAVMAFKAVWSLEQKRRENDRKILMLHMGMKDMMGVLTQLKSIKDVDEIAPDGTTIKGRMEVLVQATVTDIKGCANTCDTYSKKKLVVKVLKGAIWEVKLGDFARVFENRRTEFGFALTIHTALGVDTANRVISNVDATTRATNEKLDMIMKLFAQFMSPEQKAMAQLVEQKGGQGCLDNDKALKELNDYENKLAGTPGPGNKVAKPSDLDDLNDLKDDLHGDPDEAIEKNMATFTRKFDVQTRQIIAEVNAVVERQGDRIIDVVTAGPHDRIVDPNVHAIWKEMGWRGSVKTRHFVMALRDYLQEDHKHNGEKKNKEQHVIVVDKADEWALEYINVVHLQPISEAFDDDASGFVTVAEVNAFTTMRPLDWSLPRWIAYWAIGHHQTMQTYTDKIKELLAKMFAIMPCIRPDNKSAANKYLDTIYDRVYTLAAAVNPCYVNYALQEKFETYVTSEQERIRGNLEAVRYDIDASDTLELVTGEGRVDRYVLPVIYLLLERHFEILRVSQTRIVHPDELWDAADTLDWVTDAAYERLGLLRSIFKQQKLDLTQQFKSFSFGLYQYLHEPDLLWAPKIVQEADFVEYTHDENVEKQDLDLSKILNFPFDQEPLDFDAYSLPLFNSKNTSEVLPAFDGLLSTTWHGFFYPSGAGMLSMTFKPSSLQGEVQCFAAAERANNTEFKITGTCRAGDESGTALISFKRSFLARHPAQFYSGTWSAATDTITGTVGFEEDPTEPFGVFIFKRMKPEYMCFYPAPVELEASKARALWAFAIAAVRHSVRRDRWAWSFFKERRDNRRRFIELYIRGNGDIGRPLTDEEWGELQGLKKMLTTADSRFYHSFGDKQIRSMTVHDALCDSCRGFVGGARLSCLVCQMKDTFNTVDLHDSPECFGDRVMRDDMQKPHLPHHDLIKVRRLVHKRQFGKTYRDGKEALKRARTYFKSPGSGREPTAEPVVKSAMDIKNEEVLSVMPLSQKPALAVIIPQEGLSGTLGSGYPRSAVSAAQSQAPDLVSSTGPPCCNCKKPVTQPCWYCVQCGGETFICWDCDAKGNVGFKGHDFNMHDLVRVQDLVEEKDLTLEERFAELEERFSKHEERFSRHEERFSRHENNMAERLGQVEAAVNGRMAKVEQLLEQVLLKFGHGT